MRAVKRAQRLIHIRRRNRLCHFVDAKTGVLRSKSPEVIAAAADFYDSLRPEQQQQVREFMNKRRGGWGHKS